MDHVFQAFLENTWLEAAELQARSDVLRLEPVPPMPPSRYACAFDVPYLRRTADATVEVDPGPVCCAIRFPQDYIRSVDPALFMKIAVVTTPDFVHPNVVQGAVCLGAAFQPGTPIGALVWHLFEIVTYRNFTVDERNALNPEACRLLRGHPAMIEELGKPRLFSAARQRESRGA